MKIPIDDEHPVEKIEKEVVVEAVEGTRGDPGHRNNVAAPTARMGAGNKQIVKKKLVSAYIFKVNMNIKL